MKTETIHPIHPMYDTLIRAHEAWRRQRFMPDARPEPVTEQPKEQPCEQS